MQGLAVGRVVHYRAAIATENGDTGIRPAIITHVWNDDGLVNLIVFADGSYDQAVAAYSKTSIGYAPEDKVGYWHWPPYVK